MEEEPFLSQILAKLAVNSHPPNNLGRISQEMLLLTYCPSVRTPVKCSPLTPSASRDIRSGNEESAFRVVQDGSLRTAKQFDHNIKDKYILKIRVFDNGTPPLYSDTFGKYHIFSAHIFLDQEKHNLLTNPVH